MNALSHIPARRRIGVLRSGEDRAVVWCLCALLICVAGGPVRGQEAAQKPVPVTPGDPLGRQSPLGTLTGFSAAAHRDDLLTAAKFLQPGRRSPSETEEMVLNLSELIDRYFTRALTSVNATDAGNLADGLPANRERITLDIGERTADLFLIRASIQTPDRFGSCRPIRWRRFQRCTNQQAQRRSSG